jgi:hypothetical protein
MRRLWHSIETGHGTLWNYHQDKWLLAQDGFSELKGMQMDPLSTTKQA